MLNALMNFASYFIPALLLALLFMVLYERLTPYRELTEIQEGNLAAALAFGGALLGFALPVASALAHSVSLMDFLLWGLIAALVQLGLVIALRLSPFGRAAYLGIAARNTAMGTALAALHLAGGLLNAASMVY
ncbi:MAG: DUF350 domain-containing protein [Halothiobacillaceae bacterium]|jgi:putative membrane protein|nr:DUF350 domain-containing protein [Halothiobacillaceae bacterium]MDY0049798.1 DUF350 domain-containing protein [Halothiobacillaceae bacterium]